MRWVLTTLLSLVLLCSTVTAGEIHCKHFWNGMVQGTPETNDLVIRDCYAVSTNDDTKFADWVAYHLTYREMLGTLSLNRKWQTDPCLESDETLEASPDAYIGAFAAQRYDRGHLVPLGSFVGSRDAQQVNYYSVIAPQRISLNRGVWKTVEGWERKLVDWYGEIYVLNGTLYEKDMPSLPNASEPHRVPSGFWKIIVFEDYRPRAIAFVFDQQSRLRAKPIDSVVTVEDLEKLTGLLFFPDIPAEKALSFKRESNRRFVTEELQGDTYRE